MKTLQDYIDKLNSLNFKDMYNSDFFLTWEKTDEELEAVFTLADALRLMEKTTFLQKYLKADLEFLYSATTLHVLVFLLHLHVIFWDWKCRIWTKENLRSHMERLSAKQPT